jgi:hypothetical protein
MSGAPARSVLLAACLGLGALLAGCETGPSFDVYRANFAVTDNDTLCTIYGTNAPRYAEAKHELERRGVFSPEDWARIDRRELYKGEPECGLRAAFGLAAKRYVFVDDATGQELQREYFYACKDSKVPDCPYTDIVTVNGRVVSWSAASGTAITARKPAS